ncbi:RraA family protein [Acidisoma cellulosilytica]|uniref:Putative 4-hydroxy-4-methyl-2-oxoglutarate aldolase n=1 Tax=Acidisoma cellulosilyticum TaxID=2802395 RepID=A0A963Z5A1_9PROT|nr:RraA family protein [Acidisoma cellulosilyticum]MCB8883084.1 RraA family protein [Acidisoma cellulosilyticum]
MAAEKKLTGRVPRDAIRKMALPPIPEDLRARFRKLPDATSTVSDAMDDLGFSAAIPAAVLPCNLNGRTHIGRAVTVRNVERADTVLLAVQARDGGMGEHEAYNLAEPGDIVVIEGLLGVSNMGGQSVTLAHRAGCIGAIIDGSYRDPRASVDLAFPIWSRGPTPITGKWRLRTTDINGRVRIAGVVVDAGDLVVADDGGIVFVPFRHLEAVLDRAEAIAAGDTRQRDDIAAGIDLADLSKRQYK